MQVVVNLTPLYQLIYYLSPKFVKVCARHVQLTRKINRLCGMLVHSPGILLENLRKTRITSFRIFSVSVDIRKGYILNSSKNLCQLNVFCSYIQSLIR